MGVLKACIVCGGMFRAKTTALTCSAACWRTREQTRHRDYYEANRERLGAHQREYNEATGSASPTSANTKASGNATRQESR